MQLMLGSHITVSNAITTQIANGVLNLMSKHNGIYEPPGIVKGIPLWASSDNVDAKVDTPDGRDSFHGTAISVYQMVPQDSFEYVSYNLEIKASDKHSEMLRNAPRTILQMELCIINGNLKPLSSPQYPDDRLGKHSSKLPNAQFLDHI